MQYQVKELRENKERQKLSVLINHKNDNWSICSYQIQKHDLLSNIQMPVVI